MTSEEWEARIAPYCRQEGTRIAKIINMIESGVPRQDIALLFRTDQNTIRVIEDVLHGKLSHMALTHHDLEEDDGVEDSMLVHAYVTGTNIKECARHYGVSQWRVMKALEAARRRGEDVPKRGRHVFNEAEYAELALVMRYHERGWKPKQIAHELGKDIYRVRRLTQQYGKKKKAILVR